MMQRSTGLCWMIAMGALASCAHQPDPSAQWGALDDKLAGVTLELQSQAKEMSRLQADLLALQARGPSEAPHSIHLGSLPQVDSVGKLRQKERSFLARSSQRHFKEEAHRAVHKPKSMPTSEQLEDGEEGAPRHDFHLFYEAYDLMNLQKWGRAAAKFDDFLHHESASSLADRATFFLARCYFQNGEYVLVNHAVGLLRSHYRKSSYLAEALLLSALAYENMGENHEAIRLYAEIEHEHRGTRASQVAWEHHRQLQRKVAVEP